jgi:glycerophosphoryl diester phosphodiesterase
LNTTLSVVGVCMVCHDKTSNRRLAILGYAEDLSDVIVVGNKNAIMMNGAPEGPECHELTILTLQYLEEWFEEK